MSTERYARHDKDEHGSGRPGREANDSDETENRGDAGDDESVEGCDSLLCTRRNLRHRPVNYPSAVNGPSENGNGPSTTPVSKVPHLPGIEEGPVSSYR